MRIRRSVSLLGAAALAAALGVRASAAEPSLFQRCDKFIAEAESLVQQASECRAPVSMQAAVAAISAKADQSLETKDRAELLEALKAHYTFKAFAAGDSSLCSPVDGLVSVQGNDVKCRESYANMSFTRALAASPAEFVKVCRQDSVGGAMGGGKGDRLGVFCSLIAENVDHPAALCAKLPASFVPRIEECRAMFAALRGDGSACPTLSKRSAASCREYALFAQASKTKNPGLCGTSDFCRGLMGAAPQISQEKALKVQTVLCRNPQLALDKVRMLDDLLNEAHRLLLALESAQTVVDPEVALAVDSREERIARIRQRLTPRAAPQAPAKRP